MSSLKIPPKLVVLLTGGLGICLANINIIAGVASKNNDWFDISWTMSLSALLDQGQLTGRDSAFLYGPLTQVIAWLGTRLHINGSAFDGYGLTLYAFIVFSTALLCLSLASLHSINWKQTVIILLMYEILMPIGFVSFRIFAVVNCLILFATTLALKSRRTRLTAAIGMGLVCCLTQLLSVELGLYVLISSAGVLILYIGCSHFRNILKLKNLLPARDYLGSLLLMILGFVCGNLLISLIFKLSSANYQNFLDYEMSSLGMLNGSLAVSAIWSLPTFVTLVFIVVIFFTVCKIILDLNQVAASHQTILLGLLIFSLISLKYGLVRPDEHLIRAFSPMMLLFLLVGLHKVETVHSNIQIIWAGLLVSLFVFLPGASLASLQTVGQAIQTPQAIIDSFRATRHRSTTPDQFIDPALMQASDPKKSILSFPHDNYIPILLNRTLFAPTVQPFGDFDIRLQNAYVARMAAEKGNFEVIFGIDNIGSGPIDNVDSITRSPLVFDYIYHNFMAASSVEPSTPRVLLKPLAAPRTDMSSAALDISVQHSEDGTQNVVLEKPASCSLLRLTIRISYPVTALVGRPNPLIVSLISQEQLIGSSNLVALASGHAFQVYLPVMSFHDFPNVLGNSPVAVRTWDRLNIKPLDTGFLGVNPDAVDIDKIECITFDRPLDSGIVQMSAFPFTTSDKQTGYYQPAFINEKNASVLVQLPPSVIAIAVNVPNRAGHSAFRSAVYIDPSNLVKDPLVPEDGAAFQLTVINSAGERITVFEREVDPHVDKGPIPFEVDLTPYSGQMIHLEFTTRVRNNNANYAWAMWVNPVFAFDQ